MLNGIRSLFSSGRFFSKPFFLGLALSGVSYSALAQVPMAIPGKFAVSPVGAATYTIPIQVPPGIGGIEPNLSLSYNSRSSNGLLGVGWSLSGLSAITRCPQTNPQDGNRTGINYTASDRFCLDGSRLMLVSGTYGAANSEYRKEIDDFTKIVAYGTASGGGPSYFLVKTKDGRTFEYGNTGGSSIPVAGLSPQVIRTWALDKISDSKSNTLTVSYTQDTTSGVFNGGYYPTSISYTSNPATGLSATNGIAFSYDLTRSDTISGYQGGYPFFNRARLTAITTQTNGNNVMTYALTYGTGPSSGRSRLTSIGQCSASGTCLPSTTISYPSDSTPVPTVKQHTLSSGDNCLTSCYEWVALDIDGDGWEDLVNLQKDSTGHYVVFMNNHDGTFNVSNYTENVDTINAYTTYSRSWLPIDVNGDGLIDMVHIADAPSQIYVWKSQGASAGFSISSFNPQINDSSSGKWVTADINGDGLLDLIYFYANSTTIYMYFSNGDGTFTLKTFDTRIIPGGIYIMDVNGDGRTDFVYVDAYNQQISSFLSNGDGTFTIMQQTVGLSSNKLIQIDLNGDGLTDFMFCCDSGNYTVYLSKGNGTFSTNIASTNGDNYPTFIIPGDYDGNGLTDLYAQSNPAIYTNSFLWQSIGNGTFNITAFPNGSLGEAGPSAAPILIPGDFSAEGSSYAIKMINDTSYELWSPSPQSKDIPNAITDGIGKSVQWTENTLPKIPSTTYSKSLSNTAATSTILAVNTVTPALPVVTDVKVSDGSGSSNETQYSYDSARFEPLGRGFLGFNWMQAADITTGLVNRTVNSLTFPYLGLAYQVGTGTSASNWSNLTLITNTYGCFLPSSGPSTSCTVSPGNRYFVYPSQITTVPTDLDGTPLPQTTVLNQNPDAYGNIQTIVTNTLNSNGSASGYSKTTTNTFYNDTTNWFLGRLLKSVTTSTSPVTVPATVTPGSGGLAAAPAPTYPSSLPPGLSQLPSGALFAILGLLSN